MVAPCEHLAGSVKATLDAELVRGHAKERFKLADEVILREVTPGREAGYRYGLSKGIPEDLPGKAKSAEQVGIHPSQFNQRVA